MRPRVALDGLNFCLADATSMLGPYLGVFLLTRHGWDQAAVGFIAMASGLLGIVAKLPLGAAIDASRSKQVLLVAALVAISLAATLMVVAPSATTILVACLAVAVAGQAFGPLVTALTLGLFERDQIAWHMGRNGAFDHAGNIFAAMVVALVGSLLGQQATFLLVPLFSMIAMACVAAIPARAIDHRRARGADTDGSNGGTIRDLLCCAPLLVLAAALFLFHLANAAMLPLVGQRLALLHRGYESAMMSACIVAAQFVMLPAALCCGAWADRIGRRPLLLAAFGILPLRGVLYTLNDSPQWLIAVQLLDGVGAGALGVLVPLLVADLTRGTGRFNLSFGAMATTGGIGAALSNAGAGAIVVAAGYDAAFLALAALALTGFVLVWAALPETAVQNSPLVIKRRTCQPSPY
jgi:predicted MFS family arabinose efflux permease